MVTTQTKMHPRATRPLAVGTINNRLSLLYTKTYNKSEQLQLASVDSDGHFRTIEREINLLSKRGRHHDKSQLGPVSLAQIGREQVVVMTQNSHLVFAHARASRGWHANLLQIHLPKKSVKGPGVLVSDYLFEGQYVLFSGNSEICLNFSAHLDNWSGVSHRVLSPRENQFDSGRLAPISATRIEQGILILYSSTQTTKINQNITVGAALFAADDPGRMLWRSEVPLWQHKVAKSSDFNFIGVDTSNEFIKLFYYSTRENLRSIWLPNPFYSATGEIKTSLQRHPQNPLLAPRDNGWETVGVFNPAVMQDRDGKIHIMYRALDVAGISYLGYATSEDGYTISQRSQVPAYWPRESWEAGGVTGPGWSDAYGSGGGWGGCEDPKLTEIDGTVYLTYVGHNGSNPPRIALSKISLEDFVAQNWHKWSKPKLISEPGVVNKSGVILPEKIAGQYVVFHRVFPNILIDRRDNLDFSTDDRWLKSDQHIPIRPHRWDSRKLSVGATPIRIRDGWLVIYHAVDDRDSARYKIGAMILDADDPSKVLYRTNQPILTPEANYENDWKFGIAYPSGAAIKDGTLLVYYGGGDKFVCVATANLEEFVTELKKEKELSLTTKNLKLIER